jgi:nucleoside-diphosphate-sugar epimerase
VALAGADAARLTQSVYNVSAFSASAGELADLVRRAFPGARVSFAPDARRQAIVDSWPADVDDAPARHDWGFVPGHDLGRAFHDYLVPGVRPAAVAGDAAAGGRRS